MSFPSKPHNLQIATFHKPTWCNFCGGMIWGMYHQGYWCYDCKDYSVHRKCVGKVPNDCVATVPAASLPASTAASSSMDKPPSSPAPRPTAASTLTPTSTSTSSSTSTSASTVKATSTPVTSTSSSVPQSTIRRTSKIPHNSRIILMSDIHIGTTGQFPWLTETGTRMFVKTLRSIAEENLVRTDRLPISCVVFNGDIVDLWVHDPDEPPPTFDQIWAKDSVSSIKAAIRGLIRAGIHVVYIAGNHDQQVLEDQVHHTLSDEIEYVNGEDTMWFSEEELPSGEVLLGRVRAAHGHQSDIFNRAYYPSISSPISQLITPLPVGYFVARFASRNPVDGLTSVQKNAINFLFGRWAWKQIASSMQVSELGVAATDPTRALKQNLWLLWVFLAISVAGDLRLDPDEPDLSVPVQFPANGTGKIVEVTLQDILVAFEGCMAATGSCDTPAQTSTSPTAPPVIAPQKRPLVPHKCVLDRFVTWGALRFAKHTAKPTRGVMSVTRKAEAEELLSSGVLEQPDPLVTIMHSQENVAEGVLSSNNQLVVLGHTHRYLYKEMNGYNYVNSGSWVRNPPYTYLEIMPDSTTNIHFVHEDKKDDITIIPPPKPKKS
ncbi:hypothetical protein Pelo_8462 [Pelomyxa schiedti]|nr:hypothetical protein Pelo_8462 [Pelomyxa schiedti]